MTEAPPQGPVAVALRARHRLADQSADRPDERSFEPLAAAEHPEFRLLRGGPSARPRASSRRQGASTGRGGHRRRARAGPAVRRVPQDSAPGIQSACVRIRTSTFRPRSTTRPVSPGPTHSVPSVRRRLPSLPSARFEVVSAQASPSRTRPLLEIQGRGRRSSRLFEVRTRAPITANSGTVRPVSPRGPTPDQFLRIPSASQARNRANIRYGGEQLQTRRESAGERGASRRLRPDPGKR